MIPVVSLPVFYFRSYVSGILQSDRSIGSLPLLTLHITWVKLYKNKIYYKNQAQLQKAR